MHRSHSHTDVRHTLTHYYHLFLRLSKRYFWYFLAWKVFSFFLFARIIMPWLAGTPSAAYVTVVATADYAEPACVAAFSLLAAGTRHPLVALVPTAQFAALAPTLRRVFNEVIAVEPISNPNLNLARPEYSQTYTKLRIWGLTQYSRVLFFDSDVLFIQSVDDLFDRPAAPLLATEECCGLFNSGLMLIQPSQTTLSAMIQQIPSLPSFDGGDAGFLNSFYADKWVPLPWEYNVQQSGFVTYRRQWEYQWKRARVLHYMGEKPWSSKNPTYEALHKQWHVRHEEMKRRGLL